MIHELKTVNPYFQKVWDGRKNFEIRKNDRNFREGDEVVLREYDAETNLYSGRAMTVQITYLMPEFHGLNHDYCIFSFSKIDYYPSYWPHQISASSTTKQLDQ